MFSSFPVFSLLLTSHPRIHQDFHHIPSITTDPLRPSRVKLKEWYTFMGEEEKTFPQEAATKKARILVADDDMFFLRVFTDLIRDAGYECLAVESGLEALEKARGFHPDMIITDVVMPGMDGFEVTRRIKQDPP